MRNITQEDIADQIIEIIKKHSDNEGKISSYVSIRDELLSLGLSTKEQRKRAWEILEKGYGE